jgi:hypothetical protein
MQAENWFSGYRKLSYPPRVSPSASPMTGASRAAACRFHHQHARIRIALLFDAKTRFAPLPGDNGCEPHALNA